jgi:hypothetical protein
MEFRPPLFLITGLCWLVLSALLGVAIFLGMVMGKPLPPVFRILHVHSVLVGGVAQIILGALLSFIPPLLLTGRDRPESHPILYLAINGGVIGLLAGFALGQSALVGGAGLLVLLAFLSLAGETVRQAKTSLVSPPLNLWFYGIALAALLLGLSIGEAMAFRLIPQTYVGQGRLAHIHMNLIVFVTLTIVGTMHNLFPTVLNGSLYSPRLARLTFFILPAGMLLLIAGFLFAQLQVQIAAGAIVILGILFYACNIVRTWIDAGRPRTVSSDHFLMATFFLLAASVTGLLVAINSLWNPPLMPFGTLHLVAYTHLALVGFILQTIIGALSHLLPVSLALGRVKSNKKRGLYLAKLTAVVEQWRPLQVWTLSLGTIGLAFVATLVWQFNLRSVPVLVAAWTAGGLLAIGVVLFGSKVVRLLLRQPEDQGRE